MKASSVNSLLYSVYFATTLFLIVTIAVVLNLPSPDDNFFVKKRHQINHEVRTSDYDQKNSVHGNHKIALVIPYISPSDDYRLPITFTIFLRTAHASASLIEFLIPHDGKLTPLIDECTSTIQGIDIPPNIRFIDLKSIQGMAHLFLRVVESRLRNDKLLDTIVHFLQSYPYALVEFKPALGHIFAEYLPEEIYSHWGYSDFDIAFGDLPRWITMDELEQYDIVTYGYGDQNRVYLRGQFTFHRNSKKINNLWRGCAYLSQMNERFQKASSGGKLQFESAEGCYSHVILQSNDLRVKYAVKAFTDHLDKDVHGDQDTIHSHGIIIGFGKKGDKSVIYKAGASESDGEHFLKLSKTWFEEGTTNPNNGHAYDDISQQLQWEVGEMTRVYSFREKSSSNMQCALYWMRKNYKPDLCVHDVNRTDTLFFIDGILLKQKYKQIAFPENVDSMPFFHLQEWKKSYRPSQLLPLRYSKTDITSLQDKILGWMLIPKGAIVLTPPRF